jgi:hypothetical protein
VAGAGGDFLQPPLSRVVISLPVNALVSLGKAYRSRASHDPSASSERLAEAHTSRN